MKIVIGLVIGFIVGVFGGYFIGYDHGFEGAAVQFAESLPPRDVAGDAAQTMAGLVSVWRSTQDGKFTREFRNDGSVIDRYEGNSPDSEGLWLVFTKEIPDASFSGPYEDGAVYLAMTMSESEKLYFKVTRIDAGTLELVFLDGDLPAQAGGVLSFTRI
ncbi:MAG: hypothetical protein AAB605_01530 [Patescibacteria group bacterium]